MSFCSSKYFHQFHTYRKKTILRFYCEYLEKKLCHPPANPNPQNLPLLPIPKLHFTLKKLIKSAEPFVTAGQLKSFRDSCEKFLKCEGRLMQRYLIERAIRSHNWVDEWFRKCAFLRKRESLPMSSSAVLLFPMNDFKNVEEHIEYTAKLILGVLKFRQLSQNNKLPLEIWKNNPLDMGVYEKMFTITRLPKQKCDDVVVHNNSKHIIVMVRNNIFKLRVLTGEGKPISFNEMKRRLKEIMVESKSKGCPFGILTSLKRDDWARIYEHMQTSANDTRCLDIIQKSMFAVCIDESPCCKTSPIERQKLRGCENGFNGHGAKLNGANRWHDKTLQLFIDRDGSSGAILEHSSVDASSLQKFADFVIDYIRENEWMNIPYSGTCETATQLTFLPSENLQGCLREASEHLNQKMENFDCKFSSFENCGKDLWSVEQLSPDGIIQAALQYAYVKTHKEFAAQQETGITRKFHLGRNDIIRSFTPEVKNFIDAANNNSLTIREKLNALQCAVKAHQRVAEEVMDGKGIDCHLFGLMMACKENGKHLPKLFVDSAFLKCSKFKIVSCHAPMKEDCIICYPPLWGAGYNVCYNPREKNINICVTCRKDDPTTNSKAFLDNWMRCMSYIFDMLRSY
ncbi:hypothetical protein WA026_012019 [Henosepilachna vigintioctopunctata]|uniref:Choline/carnitine acyltransferase domain-containing protein n=1 Tax=Henosepilachna vigintioctopunctata TaxID=420089 RepID=A0AAW1VCZ0_9CUCU